jgi:hydroxymethylglutaryl-CoA lyase
MIKPNHYPVCIRSFGELLSSNPSLLHNFFINNINNVKPFDVTLRDGLQGLSSFEKNYFTTDNKKILYKYLIYKYNPSNLEIGSCVNKKVLPIFKDTAEFFTHSEKYIIKNKLLKTKNYVLVPNEKYLMDSLEFGATNFSFISSVSNSFQLKNANVTDNENLINLTNMMGVLNDYSKYKVKLYVSCIAECPIEGKIPITTIVDKLVTLSRMNFDKICLSDTCGTLSKEEFVNIIENTKKNGIDTKRFSLHLHIKPERENEVQEIVHTALDYGIEEFDVSYLKTGGCSLTMAKNQMVPNMSYEQYYKFLTNYLMRHF